MSARTAEVAAALGLESVLRIFERDRDNHVTNGPSSEAELERLEASLGRPLPSAVRRFLGRLGGGLFYQGHEIFGTRRVMIHDIELVPDAVSLRARLAADGSDPFAAGLLPIHRYVQCVHFVECDDPSGAVVDRARALRYPDFATFLEFVVLAHVRGDAPL